QKFGVAVHYATEYLTANNRSGFKTLIAYSPLHNLTERSYPAVLCITGTEDDRVAAMHSFKFVAALQAKQRGSNPILLRALKGAGHQFYDDLLSLKFFAHHLGVLVTSSSAV
ncbi:MAG: prolyl oligopeptidase family serine peptidase, partial [Cyanobacteria bacterium SZAS LIN-5]|nr:prolyl oligopeptidase family serine peptidase [Cyanobacteria bacterium SZAS LIN-5]